ncbi:family 16 glycosylhydrolase [Shewanella youngdeokensis]|uniref:Beta-glucanase n=1 Tax=Shewanella youngdeokensis TaxID=2999068 RepID=A0ABZ0JXK5_9GAMM|nr:family 16 glycosylhydrolase [Shewanella sp. DAU334]
MHYLSATNVARSALSLCGLTLLSYHNLLNAKPVQPALTISVAPSSVNLEIDLVSTTPNTTNKKTSNKRKPASRQSFADPLTHFDYEHWWPSNGWFNGHPFASRWQADAISHNSNGMQLMLNNRGSVDTPDWVSGEFRSRAYRGYGCYEISMKPVARSGVISSFFLYAGPHDIAPNGNGQHHEIDIEFLGDNTNFMQINFWRNGEPAAGKNALLIPLQFDAALDFHRYAIRWSAGKIKWYVDGLLVHQVNAKTNPYVPTTDESTMMTMMNIWATSNDIAAWAGEFDPAVPMSQSHYKDFSYTPLKQCQL